MNIAIAINSEKKGFLCSVGELLESKYGYKVSYIARDKNVEKIIMDNLGSNKKIVRLDEIKKVVKINNDNIIKEAELLESKYNVLFSSLLAMNRGLGQGYFFNVKNVPHIRKSMWSYVEKIRELVINYKAYESILKKLDVVIVTDISPIIKSICSKNKCHNFAFSQTRFGDRYMWSSDSYMTSKELRDEIDKLVVQGYNIANDKKISYQSDAGGDVTAVDYSKKVIEIAESKYNLDRLQFICDDYRNLSSNYDVVVLQGVLEHFDDPFGTLDWIINNLLSKDGYVVTSSPSFINPRGYVWMTLQLLFNVPMSLSDLHFLCPFDFEEYCDKNNYQLTYNSSNQSWGNGKGMMIDFNKRLRNALRDANMENSNVDNLLEWLDKAKDYSNNDKHTGANVIYKIDRNL